MDITSSSADGHSLYEETQVESTAAIATSETELQGAQRRRSPRKRRRLDDSHAKTLYNTKYRRLLNTTITEAVAQKAYESGGPLPSNYVGASLWTADEKERFFNALARYGRDNIREIATSINTKTEVEVRAYLLLLQQGALEKHLTEPRQQMLGYADLPAALEIGQECCDALDEAAEALDRHQQRSEAAAERGKWQGLWLLTQDIGVWVEERVNGGEESLEELTEVLPEAGLLKLKTWLELSERIFMNSAAPREHDNWRSFTTEIGDTPSIRYTAFADLYNITVSITRRLVQATLFFAMSRLRSTDSKIFGRQPLVNRRDVRAATQVLGMESNAREIWRGVARRRGLRVYRSVLKMRVETDVAEPLSYKEVEAALDDGRKSERKEIGSEPGFVANGGDVDVIEDLNENSAPELSPTREADSSEGWETGEQEMEKEVSVHTHIESSGASETSGANPFESDSSNHTPSIGRPQTIAEIEHAEDLYAEAIDQRASLEEENQLWATLKRQPLFELEPRKIELPMKPRRYRKQKEDLLDWRDNVGYRPEWEVVKPILSKGEILRQGERGKDAREEESEESDSSSGGL